MTSSDHQDHGRGASLGIAQHYQQMADRLTASANAETNPGIKQCLTDLADHWQALASKAIADVQIDGGRYHNY